MIHIFKVAGFTFLQAAASTLMALAIGLPAAFFCGRRKFHFQKILMSLSVVPFCVPSLIIALGYVSFLGINGALNQFLAFIFGFSEPPVKILYSFAGLIIAQGFYNFPLIMKNVASAWEQLPSEPAESAKLLGAGKFRIFRTVTIFQLLPAISSASLLVFIYCFLSFILVLLFGGIGNSTLEVEIYKAARASLNFKEAGILAITETLILCVVTAIYCIIEQKSSEKNKGLKSKLNEKTPLSGFCEISIFIILILIILIFFIAPLLGIAVNAFTSSRRGSYGFTLETFKKVVKMRSFLPSVKTTILTATGTGLFCTIIGFLYATFFRFNENKLSKGGKIILKTLPMIPMCISSVVAGMIIMMIVHRGNGFCLIIAQIALSWPLAFKIISPNMEKITAETLDSAKLLSKNKIDLIFRIIIPQNKKSLVSAFGFCFAVSAGDTTLPLVLAIPNFNTLSLFTYRLASSYRFNEACAAGLILAILCALIFGFSTEFQKERI